MDYNLITVLGPTAVGKTKLAAQIAYYYDGEIISADSRQVYKGMNLGTGKDYDDYIINKKKIPYHLIDLISPAEEFNVFLFKEYFIKAVTEITEREKIPVLCGGTGLYLSALIQNYKLKHKNIISREELEKLTFDELKSLYLELNKSPHNTTDLLDRNRTMEALMILKSNDKKYSDTSTLKSYTIGINPGREEIKRRISHRLKGRLESGMIEEVKLLMDKGIDVERMISMGLEYKFIAYYLTGKLGYNDMFQQLNSAIIGFAKRQMTWFRKMENDGIMINWIESNDFLKAKVLIESAGFRSI
ncbi:MAG: tRNA (adenosine(37)-N6)-dimethylallyltransferase MiaA [Ignavibacteriaceae bacterium]|nr:tRNA (adenosine(37)-N6)-dimethylallyltransferase MiaA [Ignavibacteriaceae bacterium]